VTTSANLDLVRSIYADWERGDFRSTGWADPEIEYVRVSDLLGRESRTGLAGMAEGSRDFLHAWEDVRVEATEFRELDDERVLVLDHMSGRGKTSGVEFTQFPGAHLFHVRDGKVTNFVAYIDRDRALADLGLEA
jgi:ketosteroid isomerase-like protein